MKKIITVLMTLILLTSICTYVNAYSTDKYSIDIPDTFAKVVEGSFSNAEGVNVNIQVTPYTYKNEKIYTEQTLNQIEKEMITGIEKELDATKKQLKDQYESYLSEEQINQLMDSFKFEKVETKEISTVTKNNYKCFHLISLCSMGEEKYYSNQYIIFSKTNNYTLTIASSKKEDTETEEMKNVVNSFTINNYEEPVQSSSSNPILIGAAVGAVIGGLIGVIKAKKKKEV